MVRIFSVVLTLLFTIFPLTIGQCTISKIEPHFRRSVYEFSLDLISKVAVETDNHFVTSPLSVWTLINTISLAAEGSTLSEIRKVLRLHRNKCFNRKHLEIVKQISAENDKITLSRSSTLFVDNRMSVKDEFSWKVKKTGVCEIRTISFDNFDVAATTINDEVTRATKGTIHEIVSPGDLEGVYFVLIDALYFKGTWKVPFPSSETEISAFYDEKGSQVGDVNLMYNTHTFNVTSFNFMKAKILELPYADERFSMLIFLPYKDTSVVSVIDSLKVVSLTTILNLLEREGPQTVSVQIPRFRISSSLDNLKELLTDMGLIKMFVPQEAQFPYISDYSLYISDVIQKAEIHVTEEGTVASAASGAEFESRTLPEQFVANKPFLFQIIDKQTQVILFTGIYSTPSSTD